MSSSPMTDGGKSPLQVLAWPYRGRPGKVNIQRDSPDSNTWIRAQVTEKSSFGGPLQGFSPHVSNIALR